MKKLSVLKPGQAIDGLKDDIKKNEKDSKAISK